MGRRAVIGGLVAGVLAALAVGPAAAISKPQVFSFLDVTESFQPFTGGSDSNRLPRAGDAFGFTDGLYKWAGRKRGARVGRVEGMCTFTKTSGRERGFAATALCVGGFHLPGGQVLVQGFIRFTDAPSDFRIPIVGGTDGYANVRGFVHIRDIGPPESDNSNVEFHLLP